MARLQGFLGDEAGLETVEYSIIAAFIVIASIAFLALISSWIVDVLGRVIVSSSATP